MEGEPPGYCTGASNRGRRSDLIHFQIAFHPTSPHILFVTCRRSRDIQAYDLQYVGSRVSFLHGAPDVARLGVFVRDDKDKTQQRILFATNVRGTHLISGSVARHVRVWNVATGGGRELAPQAATGGSSTSPHQAATVGSNSPSQHVATVSSSSPSQQAATVGSSPSLPQEAADFGCILRDGQDPIRHHIHQWQGADDVVASVAIHPYFALLVCASGARHWPQDTSQESSDEETIPYKTYDGALRLISIH